MLFIFFSDIKNIASHTDPSSISASPITVKIFLFGFASANPMQTPIE
jgi:hypothetical protein